MEKNDYTIPPVIPWQPSPEKLKAREEVNAQVTIHHEKNIVTEKQDIRDILNIEKVISDNRAARMLDYLFFQGTGLLLSCLWEKRGFFQWIHGDRRGGGEHWKAYIDGKKNVCFITDVYHNEEALRLMVKLMNLCNDAAITVECIHMTNIGRREVVSLPTVEAYKGLGWSGNKEVHRNYVCIMRMNRSFESIKGWKKRKRKDTTDVNKIRELLK